VNNEANDATAAMTTTDQPAMNDDAFSPGLDLAVNNNDFDLTNEVTDIGNDDDDVVSNGDNATSTSMSEESANAATNAGTSADILLNDDESNDRSTITNANSDSNPKYTIGTSVSKIFYSEELGMDRSYSGTVVGYDSKDSLYSVRYDDGDEEDVREGELDMIVVNVDNEGVIVVDNDDAKRKQQDEDIVDCGGGGGGEQLNQNQNGDGNDEFLEELIEPATKYDNVVHLLAAKEEALKELETKFSSVSAEHNGLERKVESTSAELAMVQLEVSSKSNEIEKLQADVATARTERDDAEKRAKDLISQNKSAKDDMAAEKDSLTFQLQETTAKLKTANAQKEEYHNQTTSAISTHNKTCATMTQMETEHGEKFAQLYTEIESYKQRMLGATSQITTLSADKTRLVMRIACALEDDVGKMLRLKDEALDEARLTIAAMKASSGGSSSGGGSIGVSSSTTTTSNSFNNARKISLEELEHPPIIATMRGSDEVTLSTTTADTNSMMSRTPLSPTHKQDSNDISSTDISQHRPKSVMIKQRRESSLSSSKGGGEGRVSFDSNTSFEQTTKRAKFDIFSSPVHSKENFGNGNKKKKSTTKSPSGSSSGGSGSGGSGSSSPSKPTFQQTSGTSSCEGSVSLGRSGGRRKKSLSGKSRISKSCMMSLGGFEDDGGGFL